MSNNLRLPPHNKDAEVSVLGAMLLSKTALKKARNLLCKEDFYMEQNRIIFEAILQLDDKHIVLDIVSLAEKLTGKVSPVVISRLISGTVTGEHIEHHTQMVKEKAVKREFIKHQIIALEKAYETEDIFELINKNTTQSNDLLQKSVVKKDFNLSKSLMMGLEKMAEDKNKPAEFPMKLKKLDDTLRIKKGNVVVIGAESSNGKTSLALKIALNQEKRVLFCSLEMTEQELIERMIATTGKINSSKIKMGNYDDDDWIKATNAVKELQYKDIILQDVATLNDVRKAIIKHHPSMVVIDHLQLIRSVNPVGNRSQIVGELANEVKRIAKEYKISIILLSQLSRSGDGEKFPTLSRLKESGDVENMSDAVILMQWEYRTNNEADENIITLNVAKNRNGSVGIFKVSWKAKYYQFSNLDYKHKGENNEDFTSVV